MQAYYRMETMEHFANILLVAIQLGKVNYFSEDQVQALEGLRQRFGLGGPFSGCRVGGVVPGVQSGHVKDVRDSGNGYDDKTPDL